MMTAIELKERYEDAIQTSQDLMYEFFRLVTEHDIAKATGDEKMSEKTQKKIIAIVSMMDGLNQEAENRKNDMVKMVEYYTGKARC